MSQIEISSELAEEILRDGKLRAVGVTFSAKILKDRVGLPPNTDLDWLKKQLDRDAVLGVQKADREGLEDEVIFSKKCLEDICAGIKRSGVKKQ